jgi:antitoxin (DNA-binding transcriptional repressor) of toxin-antitoxin stability system
MLLLPFGHGFSRLGNDFFEVNSQNRRDAEQGVQGRPPGLVWKTCPACPAFRFNSQYHLALRAQMRHVNPMKTASVQQVPQKWVQILEWVAAGEEVELTQQEKVVARVVPATQPDFLARAKSIWGGQPAGQPLSALARECAKLDRKSEQAMADEGLATEISAWPKY